MYKGPRIVKFNIVLGFTGTGKSTFIQWYIDKYLETRPDGKVLVVMPDDREYIDFKYLDIETNPFLLNDFTGRAKCIIDDPQTALTAIAKHFKYGLLVLEECRVYVNNNVGRELHQILIRRRQNRYDILASAHGFTETPRKFFTFADKITLFKTNDKIHSRKDVIKDFDKMRMYQEQINRIALSKPHYFEIIPQ